MQREGSNTHTKASVGTVSRERDSLLSRLSDSVVWSLVVVPDMGRHSMVCHAKETVSFGLPLFWFYTKKCLWLVKNYARLPTVKSQEGGAIRQEKEWIGRVDFFLSLRNVLLTSRLLLPVRASIPFGSGHALSDATVYSFLFFLESIHLLYQSQVD